ncbi:glycosyltransferase family 2 protein [Clostridium sp. 'White wine YQ']|uniref:glycosyltransferase family 2 protein n=1 Tax=Clostridium sp. 'White wine YQ' TaxID=3027474 RepID=UPI0023672C1F|nr:glycosyltransferase [Clostridium sp. 'White wine YQ']MDD7793359.1 glycosyltransferase [Clostridium sp. 'White wine YQ']
MKASIIITSFNSSERLYYNLLALNYQNYPHDDFEVIVVDNGSSDDTEIMLSNLVSNFPLKKIRLEDNRGIARGRNRGIEEASGDILIFHDSDMIAPIDFVKKHVDAHDREKIVVCGLPWLRIYSYFYKDFSAYQLMDFFKRIDKYNLPPNFWETDKCKLINESQIIDGTFLNLAYDLDMDFITNLKETISIYGQDLNGYNLAWRFFITNNASVDRKQVLALGLFDENIVKYGFEDYDLGIRLYKAGNKFKLAYDILSVHQEHLKNASPDSAIVNINYMCSKYNNIYFLDMLLICLSLAVPIDYSEINSVMSEINQLHALGHYHELLSTFLKVLQVAIDISIRQNMNSKLLLQPEIEKNFEKTKEQLIKLQNIHGMTHFPYMFLGLTKSIFNLTI